MARTLATEEASVIFWGVNSTLRGVTVSGGVEEAFLGCTVGSGELAFAAE